MMSFWRILALLSMTRSSLRICASSCRMPMGSLRLARVEGERLLADAHVARASIGEQREREGLPLLALVVVAHGVLLGDVAALLGAGDLLLLVVAQLALIARHPARHATRGQLH